VVVYIFTRRIKKASRAVRKKESELLSIVQEVFSSIRVVKAFAREDYEERRFERQSLENVETASRRATSKARWRPSSILFVAVGTCLMLGYGARFGAGRPAHARRTGPLFVLPGHDVQAHA